MTSEKRRGVQVSLVVTLVLVMSLTSCREFEKRRLGTACFSREEASYLHPTGTHSTYDATEPRCERVWGPQPTGGHLGGLVTRQSRDET